MPEVRLISLMKAIMMLMERRMVTTGMKTMMMERTLFLPTTLRILIKTKRRRRKMVTTRMITLTRLSLASTMKCNYNSFSRFLDLLVIVWTLSYTRLMKIKY
jgi:hypothetical protein